MRFQEIDARIRTAVDGVAASDPNPADPFRGLYISDDLARSLARATPIEDLDARIAAAAELLGLDALASEVLALCAAPELSPRYGRLLAYLHDDVTRKLASPRLVARLLADETRPRDAVLACFAHDAPLRRAGAIRLLDGDAPGPLADRLVKVPDRLAAQLLGARLDAPASDGRLRRVNLAATLAANPAAKPAQELKRLLAADSRLPVLVAGPDAAGLLVGALGCGLLLLDIEALASPELLADAALAARLEGRRLCFDHLERVSPGDRVRIARALTALHERPLLCAASRDAALNLDEETVMVLETAMPAFAERIALWQALSGEQEVRDVAAKFRLSASQIAVACEVAELNAAARAAERVQSEDLHAGARQASSTRLGELATRLPPGFTWEDLVLPARQLELLQSISAYLRHRDLVLSEWGYERAVARTQGLKVLFAGESGTGKTMAAQVLAHGLGLELFRIDLATVVSKYIGETEKNLDRIFTAAQGSNAILFFDEADALFGKRSEVNDSHDRYANIEVAYLLQKMESYPGAVVLATNFRRNIDDAFLRRLDFVIDFPFPEAEDRVRIWRLLLPSTAPLAEDLDLEFLANQFKLSGGGIRNCSLAAAFLAADDGGTITMDHLVRAVAIEYGKLGRLTLEVDFERFHAAIQVRDGAPDGVEGGTR
jgi:ATPase family associated with various cellular activities (AAA)